MKAVTKVRDYNKIWYIGTIQRNWFYLEVFKLSIIYNKLVRDRIPEIIKNDNKNCKIKILDNEQFVIELKNKLDEELKEYKQAKNNSEALEELADILELMHALAKTHGSNIKEVEDIRQRKAQERGGFQEKVFLKEVKK